MRAGHSVLVGRVGHVKASQTTKDGKLFPNKWASTNIEHHMGACAVMRAGYFAWECAVCASVMD